MTVLSSVSSLAWQHHKAAFGWDAAVAGFPNLPTQSAIHLDALFHAHQNGSDQPATKALSETVSGCLKPKRWPTFLNQST
ncbi:hypothetical protein BJX65DRAFT_291727, partial [Aspergillus insuetus]